MSETMYAHPANICVPLTDENWFITNPVHKTADILTTEVIDFLTGKEGNPPEAVHEFLLEKGFVTEAPVSLPEVYKTLPPEATSTISFSIALTNKCNMQCVYCFQRAAPESVKATLTTEKISLLSSAIDVLKRKFLVFSPSHVTWELTGGEPLLPAHRPLVEELLDSLGYTTVFITTNGTHLSEFVDVLSSHRTPLKVTLDGTPSVHDARKKTLSGEGTYHRIVEGIQKAREADIPVLVKVNIDPGNLDDLCRLVDHFTSYRWCEDEGITLALSRVRATSLYPSVWTAADYVEHLCAYLETHDLQNYFEISFPGYEYFKDLFSDKKVKTDIYKCRNDRMFFFSPDGLIYPCIRMTSYPVGTFHPVFSLDEEYVNVLKSRTIKAMPSCMTCRYALICAGGCPADSMAEGSLFHPVCEDYPRILKTYIPYILKTMKNERS